MSFFGLSVQLPQSPAKVAVAKAAKESAVTASVRSDFITALIRRTFGAGARGIGKNLPAALDGEAAGFEQRDEAVGQFTLEFEGAVFDFAAAAKVGLQGVKKVGEVCGGKSGRESIEEEDDFSGAVGRGAAEEEAFFGLRRGALGEGRDVDVLWSGLATLDFQSGEGVGQRGGDGVGGDALFFFPGHERGQRSQRFFLM